MFLPPNAVILHYNFKGCTASFAIVCCTDVRIINNELRPTMSYDPNANPQGHLFPQFQWVIEPLNHSQRLRF